jgi:hypothetical protein
MVNRKGQASGGRTPNGAPKDAAGSSVAPRACAVRLLASPPPPTLRADEAGPRRPRVLTPENAECPC